MRIIKYIIVILFFTTIFGVELDSKIHKLEAKLKAAPNSTALRSRLGKLYFKNKQLKKCIEILSSEIDELGKSHKLILAQCYLMEKRFVDQSAVLQNIIDSRGDHYTVRFQLAKSYILQKLDDKAAEQLLIVIKANKKFKPAYNLLIDLFLKAKNYYEARLLIEESRTLFGESGKTLSLLCELYSREGFIDKTVLACNKAIKSKTHSVDTFVYLAIAHKDNKDLPSVKKILQKAIKLHPKEHEGYEALGYYYFGTKNYSIAKKYFLKAIKINPKAVDSQLGLGQASFQLKQYQKTLDAFNVACGSNNEAYKTLRIYTSLLRKEKNYQWMGKFESTSSRCRYLSRQKK